MKRKDAMICALTLRRVLRLMIVYSPNHLAPLPIPCVFAKLSASFAIKHEIAFVCAVSTICSTQERSIFEWPKAMVDRDFATSFPDGRSDPA